MSAATPLVGHSAKLRRRRRVKNRGNKQIAGNQCTEDQPSEERTPDSTTVTRLGRVIKKTARFHVVNSPGAIHKKEGEDVRSREKDRENTESG